MISTFIIAPVLAYACSEADVDPPTGCPAITKIVVKVCWTDEWQTHVAFRVCVTKNGTTTEYGPSDAYPAGGCEESCQEFSCAGKDYDLCGTPKANPGGGMYTWGDVASDAKKADWTITGL